MDPGKKKLSGHREPPKKAPSLGLVIALAAAGGLVVGSAGTYFLSKPLVAPTPAAAPVADATPTAPTITMPTMPTQPQFTPAPQPPGEVPPGKVWSVEHGHWHDVPVAVTTPTFAPPTVVTPAPVVPAEKKE